MNINLTRDYANWLDTHDQISHYRDKFNIPKDSYGHTKVYLCGNSLGLQPKSVQNYLQHELDGWSNFAVGAHFRNEHNWYNYHTLLKQALTKLLGCELSEVTLMNTLSVNLHLMLTSFYQKNPSKNKILMLDTAFPSDHYVVESHLISNSLNPQRHIIYLKPNKDGIYNLSDIKNIFSEHPDISLILIEGVSYLTGQVFPLKIISEIAHQNNAYIGVDLAHAVGNIALNLSNWDIDFAVWCSYKYLNGGPGAIAGCYINKKYHTKDLPRLSGWWGNDPNTRFESFNNKHFHPYQSADGWQLSNPSIFSCAPLRASLDLFDEVNLNLLFDKTQKLTSYLRYLIEANFLKKDIEIITPQDNDLSGSQLSLRVLNNNFFRLLNDYAEQFDKFIFDTRSPNIVRLAPTPLYNNFDEIWQLVDYLASCREKL